MVNHQSMYSLGRQALVATMARSGCQIIDHWARRVYRDRSVMVPRSIRAAVNRRVKFYEGKYGEVFNKS